MANPPPLVGLRVLELAGLAPAPFAGLIFADAGADVLRIDRPLTVSSQSSSSSSPLPPSLPTDLLTRHKSSVAVDLKNGRGVALLRALARHADVLIDPFRPGVLERLGLGPDVLLADNPRLIYARLSGFRRDGRYRDMAGHDINYLAVSGVLSLLGRAAEKPTPPLNILADFAGGGLMLALGVLLALASRAASGRGQVVEASMVDGAAFLATFPRFALRTPIGSQPRGQNLLDSGCPYYDTYACADADTNPNGYVAIGALEPHFFAQLLRGLAADNPSSSSLSDIQGWERRRHDRSQWPALRSALAAAFHRHPRAHWEGVFDGTDACCTPVLGFDEIEQGATTHGRESEQRPPVALLSTPLLAVTVRKDPLVEDENETADSSSRRGQGPGVAGEGYEGQALQLGEGGEEALRRWQGWTRGAEYDVADGGGFVLKDVGKARL